MSDIADRYAHLATDFLDRIRSTAHDRWNAQSPCQGWVARDVVAHVINGHRGILAMVQGTRPVAAHGVDVSPMASAPAVEPDANLAAAFTACRDDMLAMLRDPALAATRLSGGPLGPVPVEQSADLIGALELLGHTWDLARATGGDETLNADAVARTHQALTPHYDALLATGAFKPSIPPPRDADAQTAFLCFTGRQP